MTSLTQMSQLLVKAEHKVSPESYVGRDLTATSLLMRQIVTIPWPFLISHKGIKRTLSAKCLAEYLAQRKLFQNARYFYYYYHYI